MPRTKPPTPPSPATPLFAAADQLADGELAARIARYRRHHVPWPAVVSLVNEDFGLDLTVATVRRWGVTICPDAAA